MVGRIILIGCGGLLGLFVLLVIVGALIGGQETTGSKDSTEKETASEDQPKKQGGSEKQAQREPDPIELQGNGQMATDFFELESGLAIFLMTHTGDGHFAATLLDENGRISPSPSWHL